MLKDVKFGEILCAKFCHDIAGPIGAMNNGIDCIDSAEEEIRKKAIALMRFSSKQAINRVAFFRNAYGFISHHSEPSLSLIKELIKHFFEGTHVSVNIIDDSTEYALGSKVGKLLLNITLIAAVAIMHNGQISVIITNNNSSYPIIEVVGMSGVYSLDVELINTLKGHSSSEMTTRNVQYFYTQHIAESIDYSINISQDSDGITFHLATVNSYA